MRTSGAMPHASACMIWARPISSPSAVTPLLSAMFWLLKGATRRPSCESTRHSPAASRLFPAFDMVPWIMMGFALPTGIDLLRRASAIRACDSAAARSAAPFVGFAFARCAFRRSGWLSAIASRAFSLRVRTATRHQKRDSTENESHVRTKTPCLYRRSGMSFAGVRTKRKFASDGTTESPSEESCGKATLRSPANTSRVRRRIRHLPGRLCQRPRRPRKTGHACPARRIPSMSWTFPLIRYPNRNPAIP